MNNNNNALSYISCMISAVLTATQTEHIFQIIQIVLTCLATAVALAFSIWKWYKEAMKDGKITVDEIDDLDKTVNDGIDNIKESLNGKNK